MLIGITGKKRTGKDTIAKHLFKKYGFVRVALADPIRRACKDIFLWDDDWIENHKEEIDPYFGISYRQAAQAIGTELFREKLPELFEDFQKRTGDSLWIKRAEQLMLCFDKVVVPDIRFPNEAEMIRQNNGIIIKVQRDTGLTDSHRSEQFIDDIEADFTIENNGSMDELYALVDSYLGN